MVRMNWRIQMATRPSTPRSVNDSSLIRIIKATPRRPRKHIACVNTLLKQKQGSTVRQSITSLLTVVDTCAFVDRAADWQQPSKYSSPIVVAEWKCVPLVRSSRSRSSYPRWKPMVIPVQRPPHSRSMRHRSVSGRGSVWEDEQILPSRSKLWRECEQNVAWLVCRRRALEKKESDHRYTMHHQSFKW